MTLYLLTVDQVAEALQCARDTAERAMREGGTGSVVQREAQA